MQMATKCLECLLLLSHTFLPKLFFPEGMGGVCKIVVEILEGWEGYFSGQKMEIPGRGGGLREIPSVVGVWIFSGTTDLKKWFEIWIFEYMMTCVNTKVNR